MGCSFITIREPCNNQRPRCDIAWPHITIHLNHDFQCYMRLINFHWPSYFAPLMTFGGRLLLISMVNALPPYYITRINKGITGEISITESLQHK